MSRLQTESAMPISLLSLWRVLAVVDGLMGMYPSQIDWGLSGDGAKSELPPEGDGVGLGNGLRISVGVPSTGSLWRRHLHQHGFLL